MDLDLTRMPETFPELPPYTLAILWTDLEAGERVERFWVDGMELVFAPLIRQAEWPYSVILPEPVSYGEYGRTHA